MPLDPRQVKALFNAALDLPHADDRPAFLDRECGDYKELRQRLDDLLAAYDQPAGALRAPARGRRRANDRSGWRPDPNGGPGETAHESAARLGSGSQLPAGDADTGGAHRQRDRRPVQAPRGDRRRGHGERLPGRAVATGQTAGRAQADQGGNGFHDRPRPVRVRAASPGIDGPPEHRQGTRCRHNRDRAARSS